MDSFHQTTDDRRERAVTRLLLRNIFSFFSPLQRAARLRRRSDTTAFPPLRFVNSAGRLAAAKQARGQRPIVSEQAGAAHASR